MPAATPPRVSLPDRYRVIRHLANGGMASVWEAHDELLDRDVAVKVLASHLGEDERARRRFQREARAAAGLSSHQNVVTIYDVGEWRDRVFMVMELMRGGTVGDRLKSGRPPSHEEVLRWLREAAGALDTAHAAGVVHRDIKPGNLLLDDHSRLAVADFGIARVAWEDQLTATGQVLGTAAYLSPEQALGEAATPASDRYALAVVAYELLAGERPFEAEHFAAQARAHVEDPVPPASSRADGLSKAVDAVLERGLAKDAADRWDSAAAFVDALDRTLGPNAAAEATRPTRRLFGGSKSAAAGAGAAGSAAGAARADDTAEQDAWADGGRGAASGGSAGGRGAAGGAGGRGAASGGSAGGRGAASAGAVGGRGAASGGSADGRPPARNGNGPAAAPQPSRRRSAAPLIAGLGALLLLAVVGAIALAGRGNGGDDQARNTPTPQATAEKTAKPEKTAEPTDTPTAKPTDTPTAKPTDTPTAEPTDTATPEATPAAPSGKPNLKAATQAQLAGYNARRAGDFQTALTKAREAQQLCGSAHELSPCGYALFEEGAALNGLGQPDAAIPVLQRRLDEYGDNESGEVTKELKKAKKAAKKD